MENPFDDMPTILDNNINEEIQPIILDNFNESIVDQVTITEEVQKYIPNVDINSIIGQLNNEDFENTIKILNVIVKDQTTNSNLIIRNSTIRQSASGSVIEVDMTKILNYNGKLLNLDIINPKVYIPLFNQFKNDNDIFIINDEANKRFILTNGQIRLFLPKQETSLEDTIQIPDFTGAVEICKFEINKDNRKIIKNLVKNQDYLEYLIQDNTVKAIHIPNTAIYILEDFQKDEKASNLDEKNAELLLRANSFLPVDSDLYYIYIYKLVSEQYVSIATCTIGGNINVRIFEILDITTGGDLIF